MQKLTFTQKKILNYIIDYTNQNKLPPSRQEIASSMCYKSLNSVTSHIKALVNKGYVITEPNKSRSIIISPVLSRPNKTRFSMHSVDFEYTLKSENMRNYGFFKNDILQMHNVSNFSGNNYYLISRFGKEEFCKIMISQNACYIISDQNKSTYNKSLMHKIQFRGILVAMIRMNRID